MIKFKESPAKMVAQLNYYMLFFSHVSCNSLKTTSRSPTSTEKT